MAKNIFYNEFNTGDWTGTNFTLPDGLDPLVSENWKYNNPYQNPKVNINSGWKIHGDFASKMSPQEAAAQFGLAFKSPQLDLSQGFVTIDKAKRAAAETRVKTLVKDVPAGPGFDPFTEYVQMFFGDFSRYNHGRHLSHGAGSIHRSKNVSLDELKYINPLDMISFQEAMTESGVEYKVNPGLYRAGRHFTAYPQSLENRDKLIDILERKVSSGDLNLASQNDPTYRKGLDTTVGQKNHPLSAHIQGRFTTDYAPKPNADGTIDYSKPDQSGPRKK